MIEKHFPDTLSTPRVSLRLGHFRKRPEGVRNNEKKTVSKMRSFDVRPENYIEEKLRNEMASLTFAKFTLPLRN